MPYLTIAQRRIAYRVIAGDAEKSGLVFLHEGLGSVSLWRDFPDRLAARVGAAGLIYSRFGYGQSDALPLPHGHDFLHREALEHLPALLDALDVRRPVLIGHSDGASIALIHAAAAGRQIAGLVLMAPHVFVEPLTLAGIAELRHTYLTTDLRRRLARHHADVDHAVLGWADAWLDPVFRSWSIEHLLPAVTAPMLLIQGLADTYGTLAQIARIERGVRGPTARLVLEACGHAPHRDRPDAVLDAAAAFLTRLPSQPPPAPGFPQGPPPPR
jgi:pimeloyl-ACP methyl ester carboxylesterase